MKMERMRGIEIDAVNRTRARRGRSGLGRGRRGRRRRTGLRRWPAPRRTSASSGTRSAEGSAGSAGSYGLAASNSVSVEIVTADGAHPPDRRRDRPGPVLGDPRRRRKLRRRDGDRVRALPVARGLRRRHALPDRARERGPARLARVDRRHARRRDHRRPAAPAPADPRHPRAASRPLVRGRPGLLSRHRGGGRRARRADPRARARDRHRRDRPAAALQHVHMDPEQPVPGRRATAMLLDDLPAAAIDALVAAAGPGSGSPLLSVEVRQLGGALGKPGGGRRCAVASSTPSSRSSASGSRCRPRWARPWRAHVDVIREAARAVGGRDGRTSTSPSATSPETGSSARTPITACGP